MGWSLMGFLQGVILLGPHNKGSGISFALQPTTLSCPLNVISSIGILGLLVSDCTWMIQPNLYMCLHSNCNWGNGNADYDKNMSNYFGMNIVILMTMVHLGENCCNYANDHYKLRHGCRSGPAPFKVFFSL